MTTAAGDSFEAQEAAVLSWLLTRPEIAEATDLAIEGKEEEAVLALVKAIRAILGEEGGEGVEGGIAASDRIPGQPQKQSTEVAEGQPAAKRPRVVPGAGPARCMCVMVSGLHGCGKSACCNILREVLGGTWLNYDEFASKHNGKNVRQAFVSEFKSKVFRSLSTADQDRNERVIYVDRSNISRSHRTELLHELQRMRWRARGGTILWLDFSHGADMFGYGPDGQLSKRYSDEHVSLCRSRIEQRGAAHHMLQPSAKLKGMLHNLAKTSEAPAPDELAMFDGRVTVEVTQGLPQMAAGIIEELRKLKWFDQLRSAEDLKPKIDLAWQAYQRAESQWRAGAAAEAEAEPQQEWLTQCRKALEAEKSAERARAEKKSRRCQAEEEESRTQNAEPVPLYYKIDLPEVSKVLMQRSMLPPKHIPIEAPHATLLYVGSEGDDERAAQRSNLSVEQFQAMREALEALQGEEFEVKITEIVIEESVTCAIISLPPIVPCVNRVPHVTLGTKPGVPPRYANEVLEEVRAGRQEGLASIKLPCPRIMQGRLQLHFASPGA